jgi:hypothetical protein
MSHNITMHMRVSPKSMINPSRVVNFERFMVSPPIMRAFKRRQHGFDPYLPSFEGDLPSKSGTQSQPSASAA